MEQGASEAMPSIDKKEDAGEQGISNEETIEQDSPTKRERKEASRNNISHLVDMN